MFVLCRGRMGRKDPLRHHLPSQRTACETFSPSFKDIETEHELQLQSPNLRNMLFLPICHVQKPLISAFPATFQAFGALYIFPSDVSSTHFLWAGILVLCRCHGFLWQKFFDTCNLFSTYVDAGKLPCGFLHCSCFRCIWSLSYGPALQHHDFPGIP